MLRAVFRPDNTRILEPLRHLGFLRAAALAGTMVVLPASAQQPPATPPATTSPPATSPAKPAADAMAVGSVVQLRSGGPRMTIVELTGTTASVQWFDERSGFKKEQMPLAALRAATDSRSAGREDDDDRDGYAQRGGDDDDDSRSDYDQQADDDEADDDPRGDQERRGESGDDRADRDGQDRRGDERYGKRDNRRGYHHGYGRGHHGGGWHGRDDERDYGRGYRDYHRF